MPLSVWYRDSPVDQLSNLENNLTGPDVQGSLMTIADRTNVEAMLIIIGDGVHVPKDGRIVAGVANFMASFALAVLTAGSTGIGVVASPLTVNNPYLNSWIGLTDSKKGKSR
jgi:hypothetical protein